MSRNQPAEAVKKLVSGGRAVRFSRLFLIPMSGIIAYVILYLIATFYYPGGSSFDRAHEGFDWVNNYWCDLVSRRAKNGMPNPARNIAMTGMVLLFASLGVFWYYLPVFFREKRMNRILIRTIGIVAMAILLFITTPFHDLMIAIGGGLSAIPVSGVMRELYANRWYKLFVLGTVCMVLIGLNFLIYLSNWGIEWLPLIQKITFAAMLAWMYLIIIECRSQLRLSIPASVGVMG